MTSVYEARGQFSQLLAETCVHNKSNGHGSLFSQSNGVEQRLASEEGSTVFTEVRVSLVESLHQNLSYDRHVSKNFTLESSNFHL